MNDRPITISGTASVSWSVLAIVSKEERDRLQSNPEEATHYFDPDGITSVDDIEIEEVEDR